MKNVRIIALLMCLCMMLAPSLAVCATDYELPPEYPPVKVLEFPGYFNGICDKRDSAFTETVEYDGFKCISVMPNRVSEANSAVNLDGWSYGGAKINVDEYSTALIVYKYESDVPVSPKMKFNIMKQIKWV